MIRRIGRAIKWYSTPSGLLLATSLLFLAIGAIPFDFNWILTVIGVGLLGVFLPYRFRREQRTFAARLSQSQARAAASNGGSALEDLRRSFAKLLSSSERSVANQIDHESTMIRSRTTAFENRATTLEEKAELMRVEQRALSDEIRELANSRETFDRSITQLGSSIDRLRERTLAELARRDSTKGLPESVVFLVAVPRSGSTWCFDMIRSVPSVFVEPSLLIWDAMGFDGRRYPAGLSNAEGSDLVVEVQHGVGATLPRFVSEQQKQPKTAIEKLHPSFFGFSPEAFVNGLDALRSKRPDIDVKFVYVVRSPLETMWSMAAYKQRDPGWYSFLSIEEVPGQIRRTFDVIEDLAEKVPGKVVDFITTRDDETWRDLFGFVDSSIAADSLDGLVATARRLTTRDKRKADQSGPFLGRVVDRNTLSHEGPDGAWAHVSSEIEAAELSYEKLISK